jgi:hypothetical protein
MQIHITIAVLLSGEIPFSPLERPNTEAARIFYNAPDTPPILPIGSFCFDYF